METTNLTVKDLTRKQLDWAACITLGWVTNSVAGLRAFQRGYDDPMAPHMRPTMHWARVPLILASKGISTMCTGKNNWMAWVANGAHKPFGHGGTYKAHGPNMLDAALRTLVLSGKWCNRTHIAIPDELLETEEA